MLGSARSLAIVLTLSALPSIELESCCELSVQAIAELQQSSSASGAEDAMVLKAVIEHTIIPEAAKVNSGRNRAAIVLLEDHSGPLCIGKTVSSGPCRIPEQWQQFLQPNLSRGWRGMISSDQRRRELVASFEVRNAVPHALPAINHPAVVMIAVDRREEALRSYLERAGGFASFSLPGYDADGITALVSGSHYCGNLCGAGWLFVLKKSDANWQVESAIVTFVA